MKNTLKCSLLLILVSVGALAQSGPPRRRNNVPEIDPASTVSALAMLAGTVLIVRGRRKEHKQS